MQLHDSTQTVRLGPQLKQARGAMILVHGRGSSADDIVGLTEIIGADTSALAILAPQAAGHSWYPQRFLAPLSTNEPHLSAALETIDALVNEALAAGITSERIAIAGFSQGACLALEYAARNPRRYAFVAALSGALIGPTDTPRDCGDLQSTPVLLGCAERDAHIPLEHVEHSAVTLNAFNADVTKLVYPGSAHTVFPTEVEWLRNQIFALNA